jgi:hypothetical protein
MKPIQIKRKEINIKKELASQAESANNNDADVKLRSIRPMKSMMGMKSARPVSLLGSKIKRKATILEINP